MLSGKFVRFQTRLSNARTNSTARNAISHVGQRGRRGALETPHNECEPKKPEQSKRLRFTPVRAVASNRNADIQFCRRHSTTASIAEATSIKTAQGRALSFANSQVPSSAIKYTIAPGQTLGAHGAGICCPSNAEQLLKSRNYFLLGSFFDSPFESLDSFVTRLDSPGRYSSCSAAAKAFSNPTISSPGRSVSKDSTSLRSCSSE